MKKFEQHTFRLEQTITDTHIAYFNKYGILHFKNFIPKEIVQEFIREVEQVQHQLIRNDTRKVNGIPLKFGQDENGST